MNSVMREGAVTGILPLAGLSAAHRFAGHSWEQNWGQSRGSPWAHLLTQASISEEGPLRQEHHSPRAKAGQHLDAPYTETHSCQACSASQQLPPTPPPCPRAALPQEVANKFQKRCICNTEQSNERQSRVCNRDGWLQCISDTFTITRWHWPYNPTEPPSKRRAALVEKEKAAVSSSPYPACSPRVPQGPSGETSSLCQCSPQSSHCFLVRS